MGSVPIYYQPLLSPSCHTTTDDDDADDRRRSSARRGSIARSASARRLTSCGDMATGGSGSGRRGEQKQQAAGAARFKRCQTAPGYVSFEDVIGAEAAFGPEEDAPGGGAISDPLVRTASQLYVGEAAHHQPRHRRRSPGPLGTRRGGAMHWFVKKYVSPCLGFLASAFLCGSADASATCPIAS